MKPLNATHIGALFDNARAIMDLGEYIKTVETLQNRLAHLSNSDNIAVREWARGVASKRFYGDDEGLGWKPPFELKDTGVRP